MSPRFMHIEGICTIAQHEQLAKVGLQCDIMSKRSACQNNKNERAQRSYKEWDRHHSLLEERRDLECVAHETGDENHTPSRERFECKGEDLTLRPSPGGKEHRDTSECECVCFAP